MLCHFLFWGFGLCCCSCCFAMLRLKPWLHIYMANVLLLVNNNTEDQGATCSPKEKRKSFRNQEGTFEELESSFNQLSPSLTYSLLGFRAKKQV